MRMVQTMPKRMIKCQEAHRPEHEAVPARRRSAGAAPVPRGARGVGARTGGEGSAHTAGARGRDGEPALLPLVQERGPARRSVPAAQRGRCARWNDSPATGNTTASANGTGLGRRR